VRRRSTTTWSSGWSTPGDDDRPWAGHERRSPATGSDPPSAPGRRSMVGRPRGRAQRPRARGDLLGSQRLPGDLRLAPRRRSPASGRAIPRAAADRAADGRPVPEVLARLGIVGGAVYDALVALAAFAHGLDVATRTAVPGRPTKPSARVLLSPADRGWWPTWAQSHDQRCL